MVTNQRECSRLEQRYGIKSLMAEKGKLYEIYRRMYDTYREACFSPKNLSEWTKYRFVTMSPN